MALYEIHKWDGSISGRAHRTWFIRDNTITGWGSWIFTGSWKECVSYLTSKGW